MNFIGNHKIKLNVTASTNSSLKEMVRNLSLPEGTLLSTDCQTNGKGQMDSAWISEKLKNFTGTYLLKPGLDLKNSFVIQLITSLAVKSVVEDYVCCEKSVKIKWPNDILIDRKKIAGILVENQINSKKVINSFIGIGVNINQTSFPSFKREVTSIRLETNKNVIIDDFADNLSTHIQQFYMLYKTKGDKPLFDLYLDSLYLNKEWAYFLIPNKVELMIKGINKNGMLILEDKQSNIFSFGIKEIEFLA